MNILGWISCALRRKHAMIWCYAINSETRFYCERCEGEVLPRFPLPTTEPHNQGKENG